MENNNYDSFQQSIRETTIINLPRRNISTFGTTVYNYTLACTTGNNHTRLFEGNLNVNTPLIVDLANDIERLNGFSKEIKEFTEKMMREMGMRLPLLEYQFQHVPRENWIEKVPLYKIVNDLKIKLSDKNTNIILVGNEKIWTASLIKACLKLVRRSLPTNINEIEERGMLDKAGIPKKVYEEIEALFIKAKHNEAKLHELGNLLVSHDLFESYEDRFFALMGKK